tara:strand:+ start:2063 stop:2542 length:480 start_codon:yes stop_codon:yes gene_type:complete
MQKEMNISQSMVDALKRPNFLPYEFFVSDTARKLGLDNTTEDVSILANLNVTADKAQEFRDLLGFPMTTTSFYRSPIVNKAVGGQHDSQHLDGEAGDFICPGFGTPAEIVAFIKKKGVEVDQCLVEKSGESEWVHFSIKLNDNRNEFATLFNGIFKIIA